MFSKLRRAMAPILTAALLVSTLSPALAASEGHTRADFSDVPPTHWAYDAVMYCADKGFVSGTGDNQFKPDDTITGQEFAIVLVRICLTDEQLAEYTAKVRADREYVAAYEQIDWAYLPLMIAGMCHFYSINCGGYDSHYKSNDTSKWSWRGPIARNEIADRLEQAIIFRGEYDPDGFNLQGALDCLRDRAAVERERYHAAVGVALAYGLMTGDQYKRFNPTSYITRAEACEVFMRLDNPAEREAVKAAMGIPPVRGPITIDMRTPDVPHEPPLPGDMVIRPDGTSVILERVAVNPNDPNSVKILGYGQNVGPWIGVYQAGTRYSASGLVAPNKTFTAPSDNGWADKNAGGWYRQSNVQGQEYTYFWSEEWKLIQTASYPGWENKGTDGQVTEDGLWKFYAKADTGNGNWIWQGP